MPDEERRSPHTPPDPNGAADPGLDPRRKRALFRAWHRGTREMDLIMGRFADREIATLSDGDLEAFERLLDEMEADVFAWVTGGVMPPATCPPELLERLRTYRGE